MHAHIYVDIWNAEKNLRMNAKSTKLVSIHGAILTNNWQVYGQNSFALLSVSLQLMQL